MANNEHVNKVVFGDTTLMDITDTTATAPDVADGVVFYGANGARTVGTLAEATDDTLGLVKTNSAQSIELNEDGQLIVGGRLGQYPNGGVFYPTAIEPTLVGPSTFMMTDGAKYLSLGGRTFGIMAGVNLTCKSAAAGTTQYRLSNNQSNRFACFACRGGR